MTETQGARHELPQPKEILVPLFDVITISGKSGTGKTHVMELLAERLGITNLKKVGADMRERTDVYGKRPKSVDVDVDQTQKDQMLAANSSDPLINEGRLAGVLATELMADNPSLNIVRIDLVAPIETRMRRILQRIRNKNAPAIADLEKTLDEAYEAHASAEVVSDLLAIITKLKTSLKAVKREEVKRETNDLIQWKKVHSILNNIADPFQPNLAKISITPGSNDMKNHSDVEFYDFSLNTGKISVEETVDVIIKQLIKMVKVKDLAQPTSSQPEAISEA